MSSKIREALSKASIALSWASHHHLTEDDAKECLEIVDAALAEPVRNCDVGTAEEQTKRMRNNCNKYKPSCIGCKYVTDLQKENCWLTWAQMPYEEGETK